MKINDILVTLSSILMVIAILPYLIEVIKKKTRPRVVTWIIWSVLTFTGFLAAILDKQYSTAILLGLSAVSTLLIVIFGWKLGDKKIERIDKVCLIGAVIGVILWQIFNSAAVAVIAMIVVDLIGGIPTLVHAWKKPNEETWVTFLISTFASFLTLLTISNWKITAFAFPLFLTVMNLLYALVIIIRRRILAKVIDK